MRQTVYDALIEIRAGYTDGQIMSRMTVVDQLAESLGTDARSVRTRWSRLFRFAGFETYNARAVRAVAVTGLPPLPDNPITMKCRRSVLLHGRGGGKFDSGWLDKAMLPAPPDAKCHLRTPCSMCGIPHLECPFNHRRRYPEITDRHVRRICAEVWA